MAGVLKYVTNKAKEEWKGNQNAATKIGANKSLTLNIDVCTYRKFLFVRPYMIDSWVLHNLEMISRNDKEDIRYAIQFPL